MLHHGGRDTAILSLPYDAVCCGWLCGVPDFCRTGRPQRSHTFPRHLPELSATKRPAAEATGHVAPFELVGLIGWDDAKASTKLYNGTYAVPPTIIELERTIKHADTTSEHYGAGATSSILADASFSLSAVNLLRHKPKNQCDCIILKFYSQQPRKSVLMGVVG